MKKLFILLIIIGLLLTSFCYLYYESKPVSNDTSKKVFLVTKGMGASQIASSLKKSELIKNPLLFKLYTKISGISQKIQAGQYKLSSSSSLFQIVSEIIKGPTQTWITIPEGLTNEEILDKYLSVLNPANPQEFRSEFVKFSGGKEGYLFPETYLFPWDVRPEVIVKKMISTFDEKVGDISYEKLIMASLVEEETKTDLERPIVAGILYKRLKANWPLQVDVARETYEKLGLPKKPISNPGLVSIKASLSPEDSPFWFYIHDSSGNIHYAKTLEEHNGNISKYLLTR